MDFLLVPKFRFGNAIPRNSVSKNLKAFQTMTKYSWSRLSSLQVGRFSEYFVKMEFALHGYEIFSSEVDDRGIDFVVRFGVGRFYEVQVKSVRKTNYVFMQKSKFPLRPDRLLALVKLVENMPPDLFLIPATAWMIPNPLLVSRDYEGLKSKPEWGIQLSEKNDSLLNAYQFEKIVRSIAKE